VGGTLVMVGKPDNSIRNVWITLSLINMSVNLRGRFVTLSWK
jgi:hypothetical protein